MPPFSIAEFADLVSSALALEDSRLQQHDPFQTRFGGISTFGNGNEHGSKFVGNSNVSGRRREASLFCLFASFLSSFFRLSSFRFNLFRFLRRRRSFISRLLERRDPVPSYLLYFCVVFEFEFVEVEFGLLLIILARRPCII